ncbi:MAG: cupin domain-containing protein [Bacteroidota bacterium]
MTENNEFNKSEIILLAEAVNYSEKGVISKTVLKKEAGNISLFSFDKGEGLSEHSAPFDALVQVVDGNAEIIIDKKSYNLSSGEIIIMPANIPHALKATEKFKMLLVMIKSV